MDVLSEVLSTLKLDHYVSGGFFVGHETGYRFPPHAGIKCYAVASGSCWLKANLKASAIHLKAGDCVLLSRGEPFCLMTQCRQACIDFPCGTTGTLIEPAPGAKTGSCLIVGGHFVLANGISQAFLHTLPPVVHIRAQSGATTLRMSFERMIEELSDPQPGSYLVAQQAAHTMLIQALRYHMRNEAEKGVGWIFALMDPQISASMKAIHDNPGHNWTLQELATHVGMSRTVFAQQFKGRVGMTASEYLTRWRLILANDRLKTSKETVLSIATSLGYGTESSFGRAFRKFWGRTPRERHRKRKVERRRVS
jgi:AraC-like DNA-binding protein